MRCTSVIVPPNLQTVYYRLEANALNAARLAAAWVGTSMREREREREKPLSSLRDSGLFPTSPSIPPAAPCWAKLFRPWGLDFREANWQLPHAVHIRA